MPDARAIDELRTRFHADLAQASTSQDLQAVRDRYLGRKGGAVTALMKQVASAPPEARPALGRDANALKRDIDTAIQARRGTLGTGGRPSTPST